MMHSNFIDLLKTSGFVFFFLFFSAITASAQNESTNVIDLSDKVASLPKRDGTYLLFNDKVVRFYGVKKGGKIIETFFRDKQGNRIEDADPAENSAALPNASDAPLVGSTVTKRGSWWWPPR